MVRRVHLPRGFSSAADEARARRPTDILLLIVSLAGLAVFSLPAPGPTELDESLTALLEDLPGLAGWVWRVCFALLAVWSLVLVGMAAVPRARRILLRDYLVAVLVASALALLASSAAGTTPSDGLRALVNPGPPAVYLGLRVALFTAVVVTASPHLSRPLRYVGRGLMGAGALASIALGVALPIGVAAGFAVGVAAAALTHLVFGSPGGRPTREEIENGLAELGLDARSVEDSPLSLAGSALFRADCGPAGIISVKAYGRDAWEGQLLTSTWASLTRRGETPDLGSGRLACAEHEAMCSLLAERAGVPVLPLLEVARTADDDVLVITQAAAGLVLLAGQASDEDAAAAWAALDALHATGMSHGSIGVPTVVRDRDGRVVLANFAQAEVAAGADDRGVDAARLLVTSALALGPDRALAVARAARGDDGVIAMLPYLQPPALDADLRHAIRAADWRLKDLAAAACALTESEAPELQPLARVSWLALAKVLFVAAFAYWLIGFVSEVDWSSVVAAFQSADLAWLAGALALSPVVQFWFSFGTLGASMAKLRLLPVLMLQYSIQFIALVLPASAARVALEVRFFQKWGVATAAAMSIGVIDSVMGFVVQVALILVITLSGLAVISPQSTDTSTTTTSSSGPGALAVVAVLVVVGLVATLVVPSLRGRARAAIPKYRSALVEQAGKARGALAVLRHPSKVGLMLGGNLAAQVTQAIILGMCLEAFGSSADLAQLILINTFVSLFAGFMPVPGGMGVAEAGYTAGLQAIGVPSAVAVSTALMYRAVTFYIPPLWGSLAMRWLRRHEYV